MALGQRLPFGDEYRIRIFQPNADGRVDRMIPTTQIIVANIFRQSFFPFVGRLPALLARKNHHVIMLLGDIGTFRAVRRSPGVEILDGPRRFSLVEAGNAAFEIDILHRKPKWTAQCPDHRVESGTSLLLVGTSGVVLGSLGVRDETAKRKKRNNQQIFHGQPTSTAPPLTLTTSPLMKPA